MSHQFANHRIPNMNSRSFYEGHPFHYNNVQNGGHPAQMKPQTQYRIYQGPQSLKSTHLPIQTVQHQIITGPVNGGVILQDNLVSTPTSPKQREESGSGASGSLTPTSPPVASPPLITRSPPDLPNMQIIHNGITPPPPPPTPHFNNYPSQPHYPPSPGPQVLPPPSQHQMRQLNLVWQGLPPNAQIDPDQMFILSGNYVFKVSQTIFMYFSLI